LRESPLIAHPDANFKEEVAMRRFDFGVLAIVLGVSAAPALADKTEVLYQHKSWMVEGVTADDGSVACLAEVSDPGESFSIWVFSDKTIRLQFYSERAKLPTCRLKLTAALPGT